LVLLCKQGCRLTLMKSRFSWTARMHSTLLAESACLPPSCRKLHNSCHLGTGCIASLVHGLCPMVHSGHQQFSRAPGVRQGDPWSTVLVPDALGSRVRRKARAIRHSPRPVDKATRRILLQSSMKGLVGAARVVVRTVCRPVIDAPGSALILVLPVRKKAQSLASSHLNKSSYV
jgi:hypothetical protein